MDDNYYTTIDGYFDWEPLYEAIAERLPEGGAFCEIGCWRGQSLAFLLTRLQQLRKTVSVYAVDHFAGSLEESRLAAIAAVEDIESQCRANLDAVGYPYTLRAEKSVAAAAAFPDRSFDCVYIDGSHDFDSVVADLRAWLPKIKSGGLLAGHDLNQVPVADALATVIGLDGVRAHPRPPELGGVRWGLAWSYEII